MFLNYEYKIVQILLTFISDIRSKRILCKKKFMLPEVSKYSSSTPNAYAPMFEVNHSLTENSLDFEFQFYFRKRFGTVFRFF